MNPDASNANRGDRGRRIVLAGGVLFSLSTLFPITASLLREEQVGRVMGISDVAVAAAVFGFAFVLWKRNAALARPGIVAASAGLQRAAWNLPLLLLVVFLVAGDRVRWNVLLPGLAWRAWLLANVAPWAVAEWKAGATDT
jgi:uncharacterized membrane protein YtjA (UPF0391 family)